MSGVELDFFGAEANLLREWLNGGGVPTNKLTDALAAWIKYWDSGKGALLDLPRWEVVTLWRCVDCGKWSRAKRRPKSHQRFVRLEWDEEVPEGVPDEAVASEMEEDTGAWNDVGYTTICGPFAKWRAEKVAS